MEVKPMKLIMHTIDNAYVQQNCCVDYLKNKTIEWNEGIVANHKFAKDITESVIATSLKDINNDEEYGYVFISIKEAPAGNKEYLLRKIILDEQLEPFTIAKYICDMLTTLVGCNTIRIDRMVAKNNYPFYIPSFDSTYRKVTEEILQIFLLNKDGIESNPIFMDKMRELGQTRFKELTEI